jgi:hypothetical protein
VVVTGGLYDILLVKENTVYFDVVFKCSRGLCEEQRECEKHSNEQGVANEATEGSERYIGRQ